MRQQQRITIGVEESGVHGSFIDFIICAVAAEEYLEIFTTDKDLSLGRKTHPHKTL